MPSHSRTPPALHSLRRLLVHLAGQVGAQQSGSPSNSLHRLGHSPQKDFSWQSALHIPDLEHTQMSRGHDTSSSVTNLQHLGLPAYCLHSGRHSPLAAASMQGAGHSSPQHARLPLNFLHWKHESHEVVMPSARV